MEALSEKKIFFSGLLFMNFSSSQKTWIHTDIILYKTGNSFRTVTYPVTIISTETSKNKYKNI